MSAIGDYVHLYAVHYEQTGINKLNEGVGPAYSYAAEKARLQKRMADHKSPMSEAEKVELQNKLAYIFSGRDDSDTKLTEYQNILENQLMSLFGSKMGMINFETGNVTTEGITAEGNQVFQDIRIRDSSKTMFLSTIQSRVSEIENNISKIKSPTKRSELTGLINNIYQTLINICSTGENGIHVTSGGNYKLDIRAVNGMVSPPIDSLVSDINTALQLLGATPPINLEKGDLFEYAIALAGAAAYSEGEQAVIDYVTQVVGGNRSSVVLDLSNFSKDFDPSLAGFHYDGTSTSISVGYSQQKVDINLRLGQERIAKVSAKNVNLSNGSYIHILSGSSLLYLLQGADSNFVNHYLNMVSSHPDGSSGSIAANVMSAREGVKMTVLWEALSGDTLRETESIADTFIVNDNTGSGAASFKIYDIPDLVEKAMTNIDAFTHITANGGDINSITFKNMRDPTSYTVRLSKLLEDVHAQKISVALSPTVLA